jgi:uncharacterized OB-fold protein
LSGSGRRKLLAEIEVTPEMIAAGVRVYREWIENDNWDYRIFIAEVYRAMAALSSQE